MNKFLKLALSMAVCQIFFIAAVQAQIYANSLDAIPKTWKGKVFQLSKDYPKKLPTDQRPWLKYDFRKQSNEYILAVRNYFVEGNTEIDWVVQNNKVRKWYHAPSMAWQPEKDAMPKGREFINGMTRERSSPKGELHPKQTEICQNWAVGFYNPAGGFTFGQVWADTARPNMDATVFPEGTVACKLLFSAAPIEQVPYLAGSFEWDSNIHTAVFNSRDRKPQKMRLLQVDIAVKDSRANSLTDWVMGTFVYNMDFENRENAPILQETKSNAEPTTQQTENASEMGGLGRFKWWLLGFAVGVGLLFIWRRMSREKS